MDDAVEHAQKHRMWHVNDLMAWLNVWQGYSVFPHPATGSLIVVNHDGEWIARIDVDGPVVD